MLKNYKIISTRYIKQNKKRTALTLVGIILSLALISTIGLFLKSGELSQLEGIKTSNGYSFHIGYREFDKDIYSKVTNNPNVLKTGTVKSEREITFKDITLDEVAMDKGATELFKYSIKEGRLPENSTEIAVDEWGKDIIKKGVKIGDKVTIDRELYTVVGFTKSESTSQKAKKCKIVTFDKDIKGGTLFVEVKENSNFKETIKTLEDLSKKENIIRNEELIRYKDLGSNRALIAAGALGILIVISATIIVIYNSFQINVSERLKQFGLLRSIGATKKQIRTIVFREATILLLIAVPIGLLISIGAIYSLNYVFLLILKGNTPISLVYIDIKILILSSILTIISVYISSFSPARFVGNISPLAAISSRVTIKKENIKRRKFKFLKKLFNYKVVMAAKNIRRNPSRCRTMILSIVVSSALFITFTSLVNTVFEVKNPRGAYEILDIGIEKTGETEEVNNTKLSKDIKEITEEINKLQNVKNVIEEYNKLNGFIEVPKDKMIKGEDYLYSRKKVNKEYKDIIDTSFNIYDTNSINLYKDKVIDGKIDLEKMEKENGVILVSNGKARDPINSKSYIGKMSNFTVGDEISFTKDNKTYKVKVLAIVKEDILNREEARSNLELITSNKVIENITKEDSNLDTIGVELKDKESNLKTTSEIKRITDRYKNYSVVDYVDMNSAARSEMVMIQVLVYGFILVITLISSINIINTITMNIMIRRKESAMLKSIGMSRKDLKKVIKYEGLFYGLIGGTIGAVIGCILSYSLFTILSDIVIMKWNIPIGLSLITIVVATLISYLSTLLPMRKLDKDNIIQTIREE
ncbi:MAG: ABC transporter permease [Clostridium sp.]